MTWDNFNIVILLRSSTFSSPQLTTGAALMSRNLICAGETREKPPVDRGCPWFPVYDWCHLLSVSGHCRREGGGQLSISPGH